MPRIKCMVMNCSEQQAPLHPFPKEKLNPTRFKAWLEACGDPSIYSIQPEKLHQQYTVCHRHFEEKFISRNDRLIKVAIPTINLPNRDSSGVSSEKSKVLETNAKETVPLDDNSIKSTTSLQFPLKDNGGSCIQNNGRTYELDIADRILDVLKSCNVPIKAESANEELPSELLDPEINESNYAQVTIQDTPFSDLHIDNNTSSISQQSNQPQLTAQKPQRNIIKVFGNNKEFKKPAVIKSLLGKVRLSKKGNVYILPIKGKIDTRKLSAKTIEKIVRENTSGLSRKQLLKIIRAGRRPRKTPGRKKNCTCSIHCCRQNRLHETLVRSSISSRLDGKFFPDASDEKIINPSSLETAFTISTILTNVNDKSQVEQLCQLVIESIFRLKNVNTERKLGMLTVYFAESCGRKPSNPEDTTSTPANVCPTPNINYFQTTERDNSKNHINSVNPICSDEIIETGDEVDNSSNNINLNSKLIEFSAVSENPATPVTERDNSTPEKNHFKVNLGAFHDHSYLALESKILFEKPEYLVNLININTYWACKRKSRIIRPQAQGKHISVKHQRQISRFNKRIIRLEDMLKRKTDKIQLLEGKLKYLKNIVQKERGVKRLKYPKDINLNQLAPACDDNPLKKTSFNSDKRSKGKNFLEFDMFPFIEENRESLDDLNSDLLLQDSIYDKFNDFFESTNIDF